MTNIWFNIDIPVQGPVQGKGGGGAYVGLEECVQRHEAIGDAGNLQAELVASGTSEDKNLEKCRNDDRNTHCRESLACNEATDVSFANGMGEMRPRADSKRRRWVRALHLRQFVVEPFLYDDGPSSICSEQCSSVVPRIEVENVGRRPAPEEHGHGQSVAANDCQVSRRRKAEEENSRIVSVSPAILEDFEHDESVDRPDPRARQLAEDARRQD